MFRFMTGLATLALIVAPMAPAGEAPADPQGVYEYVVKASSLDFAAADRALEAHIDASDFELLAKLDVASPEGCDYRARVFVVHDPDFTDRIVARQPVTGPFAVPLRINLFEDEQGVHVSIVNPENVNRTILLDDPAYAELTESVHTALRKLVARAGIGDVVGVQYGPVRKRGYIGKTMGVMAGGPYDNKIKRIAQVPGEPLDQVVRELEQGLSQAGEEWGLKLAYALEIPDRDVAIIGLTSPKIEAKSFSIVKQGADTSRKGLECPGIAHAAAYPFEVVVASTDTGVDVRVVEAMYRMKMFFEDAGKWAFMKNMGMPGSIQKETEGMIEQALQ